MTREAVGLGKRLGHLTAQETIQTEAPETGQRDTDIQNGDMCLLNIGEYDDWPQVAQVNKIEGEQVTITWYIGAITSTFQILKKRVGKSREPWTETVNRAQIFYHGFSFTKKGNLPGHVRALLRDFQRN